MTDVTRLSKRLSYWLRHRPDDAGLTLDDAGWADVAAVLGAFAASGLAVDRMTLDRVVGDNDKQRFEYSPDGLSIRARQGHSIMVEAGWEEREPPELLYHGTVEKALGAILAQGLRPMARHHVHLSGDLDTARKVGMRRGQPVILEVAARECRAAGHVFHLSANGVWLVDAVPPEFLRLVEGA
jgi:putative RNA 2'-phosphotransferase